MNALVVRSCMVSKSYIRPLSRMTHSSIRRFTEGNGKRLPDARYAVVGIDDYGEDLVKKSTKR